MITNKTCPICKSKNLARYHSMSISRRHVKYEVMPGVNIKAALVSFFSVCRNCRLIFQNPRFSSDELEKFYSQGYYRKTHFMNAKEADFHERKRAKKNALIIKEKIGQVNSHLDIGCSRGYLLKEVGAKVKVGVELNTGYVRIRGIKLFSRLTQVSRKSFDLVTIIHVLEHVYDPLDYLKTTVRLVSPKGFLVIEVPVMNDNVAAIGLEHTYHFEPDVLALIFKRVGLEIVHKELTPHLLYICRRLRKKELKSQ